MPGELTLRIYPFHFQSYSLKIAAVLSPGLETGSLAYVWAPLNDLRLAACLLLDLSFLICKNAPSQGLTV